MNSTLRGIQVDARTQSVAVGINISTDRKVVALLTFSPVPARKPESSTAKRWLDFPAPVRWGLNE